MDVSSTRSVFDPAERSAAFEELEERFAEGEGRGSGRHRAPRPPHGFRLECAGLGGPRGGVGAGLRVRRPPACASRRSGSRRRHGHGEGPRRARARHPPRSRHEPKVGEGHRPHGGPLVRDEHRGWPRRDGLPAGCVLVGRQVHPHGAMGARPVRRRPRSLRGTRACVWCESASRPRLQRRLPRRLRHTRDANHASRRRRHERRRLGAPALAAHGRHAHGRPSHRRRVARPRRRCLREELPHSLRDGHDQRAGCDHRHPRRASPPRARRDGRPRRQHDRRLPDHAGGRSRAGRTNRLVRRRRRHSMRSTN